MPDYRTMYDRDYIGAWDLPKGKDAVVTIARVEVKQLRNRTASNKKPVIFFVGKEKGFACNKTNGKTIASLYGNDVDAWAGKKIALYATNTTFGSETVECIRVRNIIPGGHAQVAESSDEADDAKQP